MEIIKGKKIYNEIVDLRENLYIENCYFSNCKIILGDFLYDLRNVVFENCIIKPPKINLTWMNKKFPVIFKNTKVDIYGDLNSFFSDLEKGIIITDIKSAQMSYIKRFFEGCTINEKKINELEYDDIPTYIADEYWNSKYEELNKKSI